MITWHIQSCSCTFKQKSFILFDFLVYFITQSHLPLIQSSFSSHFVINNKLFFCKRIVTIRYDDTMWLSLHERLIQKKTFNDHVSLNLLPDFWSDIFILNQYPLHPPPCFFFHLFLSNSPSFPFASYSLIFHHSILSCFIQNSISKIRLWIKFLSKAPNTRQKQTMQAYHPQAHGGAHGDRHLHLLALSSATNPFDRLEAFLIFNSKGKMSVN